MSSTLPTWPFSTTPVPSTNASAASRWRSSEPGPSTPSAFAITARSDVVQRELVGDGTELDVVRQRGVLPAQRGEAQRHDAALGIASGTALEHFAGGDVADDLLGVELVAVDAGQPHTARPAPNVT